MGSSSYRVSRHQNVHSLERSPGLPLHIGQICSSDFSYNAICVDLIHVGIKIQSIRTFVDEKLICVRGPPSSSVLICVQHSQMRDSRKQGWCKTETEYLLTIRRDLPFSSQSYGEALPAEKSIRKPSTSLTRTYRQAYESKGTVL